jgi:hypothetical protein
MFRALTPSYYSPMFLRPNAGRNRVALLLPLSAVVMALAACSSGAPSTRPTLQALPIHDSAQTIVPVTNGTGTKTIGNVTLTGDVTAAISCLGPGTAVAAFGTAATPAASPLATSVGAGCTSGGAASIELTESSETKINLVVTADPTTEWSITIYDTPEATS